MRPVKVKREQFSLCPRKPVQVGRQVVFSHLVVAVKVSSVWCPAHLEAEGDQAGERGLPHLGFLGTVTLDKDRRDLRTHLVILNCADCDDEVGPN